MCSLLTRLGDLHGPEQLLEQVQKVYPKEDLLINERRNLLARGSRMIELLSRKYPVHQFDEVDLPDLYPHQFRQSPVQLGIHVGQVTQLCDLFATWLADFRAWPPLISFL